MTDPPYHNTIETKTSNESYELEELLRPFPSDNHSNSNSKNTTITSTTNNSNSSDKDHDIRMKEKDRKGRLIVNTYLKKHHHSIRGANGSGNGNGNGIGVIPAVAEAAPSSDGITPTGGAYHNNTNNNNNNSKSSSKPPKNIKKLDEYGFIVNIDAKGTIRNEESFYVSGGASTPNMDYTHGGGEAAHVNVNVNNYAKHKNIMRRRKNKLMNHQQHNTNHQGGAIAGGTNNNHNFNHNNNGSGNNNSNQFPSINKSPSDPSPSSLPSSPTNTNNRLYRKKLKLHKKLIHRREKKWHQMITEYKQFTSSKPKLKKLHARVRKGIPNSMRGKAWVTIAQVDTRIKAMNGVYADLVEQSCTDKMGGIHEALLPFVVNDDDNGSSYDVEVQENQYDTTAGGGGNHNPNGTDAMKETIERDINRTFPRHSMFYDSYSDSDDEDEEDEYYDSNNDSPKKKKFIGTRGAGSDGLYDEEMSDESYDQVSLTGSLGSTGIFSNDMVHVIQDLDNLDMGEQQRTQQTDNDHCWPKSVRALKKATANCPTIPFDSKKENALVSMKSPPLPPSVHNTPSRKEKKKVDFTTEEGGQAILRRVLRAYSLYDPEVGYCQGMNFIAGMFITFVTEEEAFWLLVYVMNAKPCRMRGLFGVGMSEAHQVLYVAEKLIAQFNPKLSRHFDRENIHVTMFATQWLLTMYTSSFPFHIVTRVWDCFILEGWKVAYRVMLALLEMATSDLLKLRFEDILNYFKVLPFQVDVNSLFLAMFDVPLKKRHIEKYAKEWMRKQQADKIAKQNKQRR